MSDTPKKFDCLLVGEVQVSLINEPIDYAVNFAVSALEIARQRWRHAEVISGDRSERHEA